jgi:acetylornithine deacetylase/succinyl-diaminopimelate desuccinylase-like protein
MSDQTQAVLEHVEREQERYVEELKDYLRIASISTDPEYAPEVRRCAEFLRQRMIDAGLESELIEIEEIGEGRYPLVYAERMVDPDKPTVLFYGHYDVQPPDPLEEWRSPPFEPTVEGGRLVARGATDDKGQSYTHVKAVDALLAERGELPVNVKFLVEGEEESGGEGIEAYVHKDGGQRLACDCVVVSDTSMLGPGQPSLLYGLKGMLYTQIDVRGPNRDLHSGSFGGAVANPANALAHILASLRDPGTGRVLVPGFYDRVRPIEQWERDAFAAVPFDEAAYREDLGVAELFGEEGYTTLERMWARPTCDVNGLWGGYQKAGAKTIIPGTAGAKVSMRLVPDQDPKEIAEAFRRHVEEHSPPGVTVDVTVINHAKPTLIDPEGPALDAAMAALEEVWGKEPLKVREGGSIPIVSAFADVLEVPVVLMGFGLPDDRLHSPNEKFELSHYRKGIQTIVSFLDRYGAA